MLPRRTVGNGYQPSSAVGCCAWLDGVTEQFSPSRTCHPSGCLSLWLLGAGHLYHVAGRRPAAALFQATRIDDREQPGLPASAPCSTAATILFGQPGQVATCALELSKVT